MTRILQYTIILYFTLVSVVTGGYILVQWNLAYPNLKYPAAQIIRP